ncbi:ubiquinol oxidase subunit II [Flexibacterium corallicola]|uniref:ubiquinol oxidase subunit II n=1 Tax=Flexibacterium corallicola TaxID=3037259 RepID=UPI00286EF3DA|nr:ubiquinol oxidase subunit II [Pseudovibrio sp. M1P-2-3]
MNNKLNYIKLLVIVVTLFLLGSCALGNAPMIDTKGPIAETQRNLMYISLLIMLIVVLPVYILAFTFIWRYRAKGGKGEHRPAMPTSIAIEAVVWTIPALIIVILGTLVWEYTHKLDPYKKLQSTAKPITIQAIALDWKWLFLYPEQGIGAVNELVIPKGRPITIELTSDTVMNSFIIPALSGQIYAMAGMKTELNILASEVGKFRGRNTQFSGTGYPLQYFDAISLDAADFEKWVATVKGMPEQLTHEIYADLEKPSIGNKVEYFSSTPSELFNSILAKYGNNSSWRPSARQQPTCEGGKPCLED